jgi:O-antigen ligase
LKKSEPVIPKVLVPTLLIALGLLLCCIFGGYVLNDETKLQPGFGELISAVFGGSDAPVLTHFVLGLPIIGALTWGLFARRIQQVPSQLQTGVWLLFFVFLGASILFSSFQALSLTLWLEWLVYGAAFFGVVSCVGRNQGPTVLLASIAAGTSVVAIKGILEYGEMRSTDPSWRVFAGWVNPNATAAILLAGFFVCLALSLSSERYASLAAGVGAVFIAFCIFLTGSKGGASLGLPIGTIAFAVGISRTRGMAFWGLALAALLAMGIVGVLFVKNVGWLGLVLSVAFLAVTLLLKGDSKLKGAQVGRVAGCFGAACVLIVLLFVTTPQPSKNPAPNQAPSSAPVAAASPIARVAEGGGTQDQSATFRLNLWKSSLYLINSRPLTGFGLGSYRYESSRAGIATATAFSHNVLLQIWSECGIVPTGLFIVGVFLWFASIFRNNSTQPSERSPLFAGVVAAVVALLAHSLVDSDLYYFGIGVVFFALLGTGLLLSVDSVAPEFVPKSIRLPAGLGLCGLIVLLFVAAEIDDLKSSFRAGGGDIDTLKVIGRFDGEADHLISQFEIHNRQTSPETLELLQSAFRLSPSANNAMNLASGQQRAGEGANAVSTLEQALSRDPNNLTVLDLLMRIQQSSGDESGALQTAQRLVDVEKSPYFTVRSVPESVPTETYLARIDVLAPNEKDPKVRADLLGAAVRGMMPYADGTAKIIFHNQGNNPDPSFHMPGYDRLMEARAKLEVSIKAASDAASLYRATGDLAAAAEMDTDGKALAADLAEISAK